MKIAKEAMKRQFNKKRWNLQGLKVGDNVWLEAKNIYLNRPLKKLDQKRCGLFRILKDIGQEVFQLELLEEWMIYNVFNENLLTQCKELQFKGQHMELAPPLLWDTLNINNFYFILFYFFWFYIDFIFLLDNEEAHDTEVTW